MSIQTDSVQKLWEEDYFSFGRETNEISELMLKRFKCTYSNWPVLLKRCKFLRRIGNKWIQKSPSTSKGITVVYVEAGKPRQAVKRFEELFQTVAGPLLICDPYLTKNGLDLLEKISDKNIKFLFSKIEGKLSAKDIDDFKKENSLVTFHKYEMPHLHDRYILGTNFIILVGHGLSLRDKETFMILLEDSLAKDTRLSLTEQFNRRWKE